MPVRTAALPPSGGGADAVTGHEHRPSAAPTRGVAHPPTRGATTAVPTGGGGAAAAQAQPPSSDRVNRPVAYGVCGAYAVCGHAKWRVLATLPCHE